MQKNSELASQRHNRLAFAYSAGQLLSPSLQCAVAPAVEGCVRRLNQQATHLCIPFTGDGSMPLSLSGISHPRPEPQTGPNVAAAGESLGSVNPADERQSDQRAHPRYFLK